MKKILIPLLMLSLLSACKNKENTQQTATPAAEAKTMLGQYEVAGDSLIIPTFDIEYSLSEKAAKKLTNDHETVIVSAMFSGETNDPKYQNEEGPLHLATKNIELNPDTKLAHFENVKFDKKLYEALSNKDIMLLINIYTGRKSSGDNLLDCDILDKKASEFKNQKFALSCKLIGE